ncbi:thiamine pyrophosphate-binding protein [Anoxybacillus ayderensis]|uniref:thiamine pyrophosphate-binding protein n=2 Tax=Anoxybacillaceae TaxID=3120669 RepID=UPI000A269BED|nr:thiamine pyrophosphate-binding protein [Anoxybacillus ayderensis]MED0658248.1 thiamine pyrophosphate-binding protein [Anoxybacillus ayderensis]OSX53120.1 decarboxylase [Anoxybacillus ayderensis]
MNNAVLYNTKNSVASSLLKYLYHKGIRHIFGVVGREASSILFNEQEGIDFILTRHEFTAGIMADVLARLTGNPQVCWSTIGPGVTNLATGISSACLDRSPVIALAAQAETNDAIYNQTHQCLDNVSIIKPMAKFAAEITNPDDIIPILDQAFEASMTEQLGPSFISIPIDILKTNVSEKVIDSISKRPVKSPKKEYVQNDWKENIDQVVKMIKESNNPLIIVGNAVIRANCVDKIRELSESLQIPIVSSYTAKGVLPSDHPLNFGAISGYMDGILNYNALENIFGPVDLIITVGYDYAEDLRPSMWKHGKEKKVVRIASYPNLAYQKFKPDVDVVNNISDSLEYLQNSLIGCTPKKPHDISGVRKRIEELLEDQTENTEGLLVNQVMGKINKVLGNGTLVSDVGFFRHFAVLFSKINKPNGFITSAGCSTFGFGLPAAMAAKMANRDELVILVCGDGGFHSNSQDLETAVRYNLPIVIVLLNNNSNGLIRLYQSLGHQETYPPAVNFGKVDFVQLAKANGCEGFYASNLTELELSLEKAIKLNKPVLIEVPIVYHNEVGERFRSLDVE